jgi:hypothetical protein
LGHEVDRNNQILLAAAAVATAILAPALVIDFSTNASHAGIVAEWITALATAVLAYLAAIQFRSLVRTSNADFIHKLNSDYYTRAARRLRRILAIPELNFRVVNNKGVFFY